MHTHTKVVWSCEWKGGVRAEGEESRREVWFCECKEGVGDVGEERGKEVWSGPVSQRREGGSEGEERRKVWKGGLIEESK